MPRPEACCLMASLSVLYLPASSPSPDRQDTRRPRSRNPSTWSVEDVVWFVKDADPQALGPHVELFRKHVRAVVGLGAVRGLRGALRYARAHHSREARRNHRVLRADQPPSFVCPIRSLTLAFIRSACFPAHPSVCLCVRLCINKHL